MFDATSRRWRQRPLRGEAVLVAVSVLGLVGASLWLGKMAAPDVENPSQALVRLAQASLLDQSSLQPGDVVLSKGRTGASHAVMAISGSADAWTHAGLIAAVDRKQVEFVHATPSFVLKGSGSDGGGVERLPIGIFLAQKTVVQAGVFRVGDASIAARAGAWAGRLHGRGYLFDQKFDLETTADIYCTELIYRAFDVGAGFELFPEGLPQVQWMFREATLLLPDHFANSPRLTYLGDLK